METKKKNYFRKRLFYGFAAGLCIIFTIGIHEYVQAVTPGTVKAPTFAPYEDDVQLNFLSDLKIVAGGGSSCAASGYGPAYAKATCPAGYKVLGGSCSSAAGWPEILVQKDNALSDLSAWECYMYPESDSGATCHSRGILAQALCVKAP